MLRLNHLPKLTRTITVNVLAQTRSEHGGSNMDPNVRVEENLYQILELENNKVTSSQIKSAYYHLSKKCHPDMNPSEEARVQFARITQAYETLSNWKKRREYDAKYFSHRLVETDKPQEPQYGPDGVVVPVQEMDEHQIDTTGRNSQENYHLASTGHSTMDSRVSNFYNFNTYQDRRYKLLIKAKTGSRHSFHKRAQGLEDYAAYHHAKRREGTDSLVIVLPSIVAAITLIMYLLTVFKIEEKDDSGGHDKQEH